MLPFRYVVPDFGSVTLLDEEWLRKGALGSCQVAAKRLERYFEGYSMFQQKRGCLRRILRFRLWRLLRFEQEYYGLCFHSE
ncbi:hypothetical protein Tco_0399184 [Tanacetum coccineum]